MQINWQVQSADHGERAVDVLIRRCGMSRLLTKKIRLYGRLLCNGQPHRMIDPVCSGDCLEAVYAPHGSQGPLLRDVPGVAVRYRDDWLLVLAKPAGLVAHPTFLHDQDALTALLSDRPLHPVSRLDRDTSGLVLIALNGHAHHVVSGQIEAKRYLALLHGRLPAPSGLIRAPIRRAAGSIILREVHPDGAPARTLWRVCRYYPEWDVSLVSLTLLSGRTHQLRLHSQAIGCPIVGDDLYSGGRQPDRLDRLIGRQALHAALLCFRHPLSGETLRVTAPLPDDFRALLAQVRAGRPRTDAACPRS